MTDGVNTTEDFVYRICKKTFLSLWSYINPQGKTPGKELCDILIVCDPHVVIVSVKSVQFKDTGRLDIDWQRWQKKAIEESVQQLYGAARWTETADTVIKKDGSSGLALPPLDRRITHRIAVALGSEGLVPVHSGDFGKGFVHVLTDDSLETVLNELDTITDLTEYLTAKEIFASKASVMVVGSENDLLAYYLSNNRTFPNDVKSVLLTDDIWDGFAERPEKLRKQQADRISYAWDKIIDVISQEILQGNTNLNNNLSEAENVLRDMAYENRFSRRQLGYALADFFWGKSRSESRSRIIRSLGPAYVLLRAEHAGDRSKIQAELECRCYVVRGLYDIITVIGIAIDTNIKDKTESIMVYRLHMPEWTEKDKTILAQLQKDMGAFVDPISHHWQVQEYPSE